MGGDEQPVPAAVEEYLVSAMADAGAAGGAVGGALATAATGKAAAAGGARGGARGGERAARRMRTVVVDRDGPAAVPPAGVLARVQSAHPRAVALPAEDGLIRVVVPTGLGGVQRIVVDVRYPDAWGPGAAVGVRGYGKEGLLSRHPTSKTVDAVLDLLRS